MVKSFIFMIFIFNLLILMFTTFSLETVGDNLKDSEINLNFYNKKYHSISKSNFVKEHPHIKEFIDFNHQVVTQAPLLDIEDINIYRNQLDSTIKKMDEIIIKNHTDEASNLLETSLKSLLISLTLHHSWAEIKLSHIEKKYGKLVSHSFLYEKLNLQVETVKTLEELSESKNHIEFKHVKTLYRYMSFYKSLALTPIIFFIMASYEQTESPYNYLENDQFKKETVFLENENVELNFYEIKNLFSYLNSSSAALSYILKRKELEQY